MLIFSMDSKYKHAVEWACIRLLVELNVLENISLPYAIPYMNYVMSWKDHLPIKTVIIGQNPYPENIYPYMGAAMSYDSSLRRSPTRSAKAVAEDLYDYNRTPMSETIECIQNSWHLINHGTILINRTVFSSIYPELKNNCRPIREMEFQCIALKTVFTASYFMGQTDFTVLGMGEQAALMMDLLKSWCPSDAIKMKAIGCRNPAARERGDSGSRAFTLKQSGASKLLAAEVAWYHSMPPQKDFKTKRLENTEKSLNEALESVVTYKNGVKTELDAAMERLNGMEGSSEIDKLKEALSNTRKSIIAHTNSIKSHQMSFIQYVNTAKSVLDSGRDPSETASNSAHKDVAKLALNNPPRKKHPVIIQTLAPAGQTTPDIAAELGKVKEKKVKSTIPSNTGPAIQVSTAAPSVTTNVGDSLSVADGVTPKKKRSRKDVNAEEGVGLTSFANWFKSNIPDDPVYAGVLQTAVEDKNIGTTEFAPRVLNYIRMRKKADVTYDSYTELEDESSESFKWALELKQSLIEGSS